MGSASNLVGDLTVDGQLLCDVTASDGKPRGHEQIDPAFEKMPFNKVEYCLVLFFYGVSYFLCHLDYFCCGCQVSVLCNILSGKEHSNYNSGIVKHLIMQIISKERYY